MMRPLPKKRLARRRSTKATVVEALARRDAHRRSVRGVTAASLRSNAAAASPLNRLGQIRGDGGLRHGAAAARPPRRRAPGARTNSCQQKIRGLFTYRRACVCSFFRAKRAKSLFSPPRNCSENGFFDSGNLPCRAYMHLKFERPRCFWCRDRAPEPVLLKIRT